MIFYTPFRLTQKLNKNHKVKRYLWQRLKRFFKYLEKPKTIASTVRRHVIW
jgi:hypothetical protein